MVVDPYYPWTTVPIKSELFQIPIIRGDTNPPQGWMYNSAIKIDLVKISWGANLIPHLGWQTSECSGDWGNWGKDAHLIFTMDMSRILLRMRIGQFVDLARSRNNKIFPQQHERKFR